jgi:glucosamine-6-phosphate isomerase
MTLHRFATPDDLARHAARYIADIVTAKPDALICVASGETPILTYRELARLQQQGEVDFGQCRFVGLDEWVGFGPTDEGSCAWFLYRDLFVPLAVRPDQIHYFDAKAADLPAECARIDAVIAANGGLDVLLVGIGTNGHLALNEPGTPFGLGCHVVELTEDTKTVGQKYFSRPTALSRGITVGLRHLTEARAVMLLATGPRKTAILHAALTGPVGETVPASIVQQTANAGVWADNAAAALLMNEA